MTLLELWQRWASWIAPASRDVLDQGTDPMPPWPK